MAAALLPKHVIDANPYLFLFHEQRTPAPAIPSVDCASILQVQLKAKDMAAGAQTFCSAPLHLLLSIQLEAEACQLDSLHAD